MKILRVVLFVFILINFSTGFFGLSGRGVITGTVKDADSNLVDEANVTTDKTGSSEITRYSVKTSSSGIYTLDNLPDGIYTITATKGIFTGSAADITIEKPSFFACSAADVTAPDIQLGTAQKTIVDEDFESYSTFENGSGGWFAYLEGGTTVSIASGAGALSTDKSLLLEASNDTKIDVLKAFDPALIDSIDIETYIMTNSSTTRFYLGCENPEYGGVLLSNVGGTLIVMYGENFSLLKITGIDNFEKDTWYKVKINIDINLNTWKVSINDDQDITSGDYNDTICPSILEVLLRTDPADPLQKVYFDEVSVTCYMSDASKTFSIKSVNNLQNTSLIDLSHIIREIK